MTMRMAAAGLAIVALAAFVGCAGTAGKASGPKFALRINCAADKAYTDTKGNIWQADQETGAGKSWGADGGMTVVREGLEIKGVPAPAIYVTERYSMDSYTCKVPNGSYTVRLHFAETYDGISGNGERIFDVLVNGKTMLKGFDPFKAAGGWGKPVVKECAGVKVTDGTLKIAFTANVQNPEINGIEILGE
jgi:hypothetical protein